METVIKGQGSKTGDQRDHEPTSTFWGTLPAKRGGAQNILEENEMHGPKRNENMLNFNKIRKKLLKLGNYAARKSRLDRR